MSFSTKRFFRSSPIMIRCLYNFSFFSLVDEISRTIADKITMDSRNFSAMMDSPKASRKPFGEITNNVNHQTPLKEEQPAKEEEALTPLANLKMLIRVASETATPELPPPPKRELFREDSIENEDHDYSTLSYSGLTNTISGLNMVHHQENFQNFTPSPSSSSSLGPPKVSRKQKSLGLLCEKFMSRFPESVGEGDKCEIQLDDLAKQMATERRRIYDIVNVLEAVQMMTKVRLKRAQRIRRKM